LFERNIWSDHPIRVTQRDLSTRVFSTGAYPVLLTAFSKLATATALSALPSWTLNALLLSSYVTDIIRLPNTEQKVQHKTTHSNAIFANFRCLAICLSCERHVSVMCPKLPSGLKKHHRYEVLPSL